MSPHTSPAMALPETEQPGPGLDLFRPARQVPASLRLAQPDEGRPGGARPVRPLDVAECALCGFTHPLGLMVADGGAACTDVKWYCKDTRSCTERWVMARADAARAETASAAEQPATTAAQDGDPLVGDIRPLSAAS